MLLDCEARQLALLKEVPLQANVASYPKHVNINNSKHTIDSNSYSQEFKQGHRGQCRYWSRGRARVNSL
ncbi:hypothetical protein J1N35_008626, partial [Gossypium stocksii]